MDSPIQDELLGAVSYIVKNVNWKGHFKRLALLPASTVLNGEGEDADRTYLDVALSACVTTGDTVSLREGEAWVRCENRDIQILPIYVEEENIPVGGLEMSVLIKEITDADEHEGYKALAKFHYRDQELFGRTARLIVRGMHPSYPCVLGYIELATPLYMNKARAEVLDAPFKKGDVSWTTWDSEAARRYIRLIVRIARCVVHPEFRGIGLGQVLVRHVEKFARSRWQSGNYSPYFLEISADMLKYVPFAEKAGMHFIGETEGNLNRVAKDMTYLTDNAERVRAGEVASEDSFGIVDQQVARMERFLKVGKEEGLDRKELLQRLKRLREDEVLRDYALFHEIVSLPKPTYLKGLCAEAEAFLQKQVDSNRRYNDHGISVGTKKALGSPIRFNDVTISYKSKVRRTRRTHAIQQAFGISPDNVNNVVLKQFNCDIEPGEVVLITGPSGSGKTTVLTLLLEGEISNDSFHVEGEVCFPSDYDPGTAGRINSKRALIEVFNRRDIRSSLHIMGRVGLSDAFLFLKRFSELSKGQQYRAMLGGLICRQKNVWLIDEFCANLDLVTANVVADKTQDLARRLGVTLIVAAPHCELFLDSLKPDKVIILTNAWDYTVTTGHDFSERFAMGTGNLGEVTRLRLPREKFTLVKSAEKTAIIRKGKYKLEEGPSLIASGGRQLFVYVDEVSHKKVADLSEEDARNSGHSDRKALITFLKQKYKRFQGSDDVTVISFTAPLGRL